MNSNAKISTKRDSKNQYSLLPNQNPAIKFLRSFHKQVKKKQFSNLCYFNKSSLLSETWLEIRAKDAPYFATISIKL